jgi:hypothetical protein
MAGYTYTTLRQAIQDYTDNTETTFVNNIDSFIEAAEERILKETPLEVFRKNATATMSAGARFFPKPVDWLYSFSLAITTSGEQKVLLNKDVNFLQEFWPDFSQTSEPRYYSDFDVNNFLIAPTPDENYNAELHYFYRPQSITDSPNGESWLGTNAGPAMLYGSLVEAYTFMKGEQDMVQQYEQQFQTALSRLNGFAQSVEGRDFFRRPKD